MIWNVYAPKIRYFTFLMMLGHSWQYGDFNMFDSCIRFISFYIVRARE